MKKKTIGMVLAALLSLGAVAAVGAEVAEHHGHGGRHGRGGMFMGKDMESRLNLTADQKAKLDAMHQRQREQMKAQFAEGPQGQQGLMQEVFKDNPNQAEIQKRVMEIQQRQAAELTAHVAAMQEFNSILTPEQRGEMQKLMAERSQKMQEWQAKRAERHQQKNQDKDREDKPKQP